MLHENPGVIQITTMSQHLKKFPSEASRRRLVDSLAVVLHAPELSRKE